MKKFGLYITTLALAMGSMLTSCNDDKEEFYAQAPSASTLAQNANSIVVTEDNLNNTVLTLTFSASESNLQTNTDADLGYGAYLIECSLTPDFSNVKSEVVNIVNGNNSKSYTALELNILAIQLGAEPEKESKLYFRVKHTYNESATTLGTTSNVTEFTITPIDLIPTLNVVSKDGSTIIAQLVYNEETKLYEGEYNNTEWNFYFVDRISGTIYGCDDDHSKLENDVNRSYKLVKDRSIGDDFSMWFDPTVCPIVMKANLENMTWDFTKIATEKKDLSGVIVLLVGNDMGWNEDWTPSAEVPGVEVTKNGDEYTAVFENVKMTSTGGFGFRATQPAAKWIGKGGITISDPIIEGSDNLQVSESGIYTVTFKAVAEDDGSISYSVTAEKTAAAEKEDLSGVKVLLVGNDMGWNVNWTPSADVPGVEVTKNGDEYTAVFENVEMTSTGGFGFRATQPAAGWIGKGDMTVSEPIIEGSDNLQVSESGIYTITFKAVAEDDGNITYSVTAEKTAAAGKKDLSDVELGIKGNGDWNNLQGAVTPTKNGDVYTYVISNVAITDVFKFVYGDNWLGYSNFESVDSQISSEGNDANLGISAGTYTFTVVLTANDDGTVTATSVTALKDE